MSTPSLIDDILRSLSHLPTPSHPSSAQPYATTSSVRYASDQHSPSKASNTLSTLSPSASQDAKSLFLTLHFLFPHELLPALDLLDRGLVTRLIPSATSSTDTDIPNNTYDIDVFFVQSASAATSQHHPKHSSTTAGEPQGRFRNALTGGKGSATQTYYEVRLDSWNCSCAAFAFSSFTSLTKANEDTDDGSTHQPDDEEGAQHGDGYEADHNTKDPRGHKFGGTLTIPNSIAGVPVCKHILAAMMARAAPGLFAEGVHVSVRREVGTEEMAGWGAGWGD